MAYLNSGRSKGDTSDDEKNEGDLSVRNPKFHISKGQPISAMAWNHRSEAHEFYLDWM